MNENRKKYYDRWHYVKTNPKKNKSEEVESEKGEPDKGEPYKAEPVKAKSEENLAQGDRLARRDDREPNDRVQEDRIMAGIHESIKFLKSGKFPVFFSWTIREICLASINHWPQRLFR